MGENGWSAPGPGHVPGLVARLQANTVKRDERVAADSLLGFLSWSEPAVAEPGEWQTTVVEWRAGQVCPWGPPTGPRWDIFEVCE